MCYSLDWDVEGWRGCPVAEIGSRRLDLNPEDGPVLAPRAVYRNSLCVSEIRLRTFDVPICPTVQTATVVCSMRQSYGFD